MSEELKDTMENIYRIHCACWFFARDDEGKIIRSDLLGSKDICFLLNIKKAKERMKECKEYICDVYKDKLFIVPAVESDELCIVVGKNKQYENHSFRWVLSLHKIDDEFNIEDIKELNTFL